MTNQMTLVRRVLAVVVVALAAHPAWAQSLITEPHAGTLIVRRTSFPVAGVISSYDRDVAANFHYWISIASVTDEGKVDLHWPKFYVKDGQFHGWLSDGGQNPFPQPQPMLIVLLKVDDAANQRFVRWLQRGRSEGYPGLTLKHGEIVARVPIQFP
jgi:hypothetical protein